MNIGESGHGVQSTPSDDSYFSFLQLHGSGEDGEVRKIIQKAVLGKS